MEMIQFIILKIQPLQVPTIKTKNPFAFDKAINSASFDHHWGYQGDLGCQVSENETSFSLWAPTATAVQVVVYESVK